MRKMPRHFPLILIQGKVVHHWQHTLTNWSAYMAQFSEGNYVQVHPETVQSLGIKDGDWVYLETESGKIKAKAKLSELILPGVVWTPSHPQPSAPYQGNAGQIHQYDYSSLLGFGGRPIQRLWMQVDVKSYEPGSDRECRGSDGTVDRF